MSEFIPRIMSGYIFQIFTAFGDQTIVLFCVSVPYIGYMLRRFGE